MKNTAGVVKNSGILCSFDWIKVCFNLCFAILFIYMCVCVFLCKFNIRCHVSAIIHVWYVL